MTEHYKTIEECPKNKCPFILKSGKHKDLCCSRPAYPKHTFEERKYCRSHYEALTKGIQVEQKHEDEVKFNNEEVNNIHNEVEDIIPKMKSPIVKEKPKKIEEIVTKPKPKETKKTPVIKVEKPKVVKEESEESISDESSYESSYETSESSEEEIPKQQSFTYKTPKKVNTYDKTKFGEMLQQAKINTLSQSVNISKRGFLSK